MRLFRQVISTQVITQRKLNLKKNRLNSSNTDSVDLELFIRDLNELLYNKIYGEIPKDIILDPTNSKFSRTRASLLNKYHNFFWQEDTSNEDWQNVLSIFKDYLEIRKVARQNKKLNKDDFNNLLSGDNLRFLHRLLTDNLVVNPHNIEAGIDDFEMSCRIPYESQSRIIRELKNHKEVKKADHYTNPGYRKRYSTSIEFRFKTGGVFVFHGQQESSLREDCLISFRLSETPWRNIKIFFNCIKVALRSDYEEFQKTSTITRKDPFILVKGIPLPLFLIDTQITNNGKIIKRTYFDDIENTIHGSIYLGDRNSSHTIIYCMYSKVSQLRKKLEDGNKPLKTRQLFTKLFEEMNSLYCITKIERRIMTHQQGIESGLIKDMHILRGHTFDKLTVLSPLLFEHIPHTIVSKIFQFGFANVLLKLSPKQRDKLSELLNDPKFTICINSRAIVENIENKLTKLQNTIQNPSILPSNIQNDDNSSQKQSVLSIRKSLKGRGNNFRKK